jgi:hypothetical protein
MHDHFCVAVRLENGAAMLQPAPPLGRIRKIAVVPQRHFALVAVDHDGLRVQQRFVAGGGIARVANRQIAGQVLQHRRRKNFFDFAHRAMQVQFRAVARNDSSRFLPAMLQRIQAQIRQLRGLFMPKHAEHTTFVVKTVVGVSELLGHFYLTATDQLTLSAHSNV